MAEWNKLLDMLIIEAYEVGRDVELLADVLRSCPACRVDRADRIEALDRAAGLITDAMTALRALKVEREA